MLYHQIKELYPDISDSDFRLRDDSDGRGAYIEEWKSSYPKPTQAQLDSVKSSAELKVKWWTVRAKRNRLIKECEWMVIKHITQKALAVTPTLTDLQYTKLLQYMQDLRDITKQANPDIAVFPVLVL